MYKKLINNARVGCENNFVSYNGSSIYVSAGIKRYFEENMPEATTCDVYLDEENRKIKVCPNENGEYCMSMNRGSGFDLCAYALKNIGLARGTRYPVKLSKDYFEFLY